MRLIPITRHAVQYRLPRFRLPQWASPNPSVTEGVCSGGEPCSAWKMPTLGAAPWIDCRDQARGGKLIDFYYDPEVWNADGSRMLGIQSGLDQEVAKQR